MLNFIFISDVIISKVTFKSENLKKISTIFRRLRCVQTTVKYNYKNNVKTKMYAMGVKKKKKNKYNNTNSAVGLIM